MALRNRIINDPNEALRILDEMEDVSDLSSESSESDDNEFQENKTDTFFVKELIDQFIESFREELIDQLIGSTRSKNSGRPSNSNEHITLRHTNVGVHKPLVNDKLRDCKNCSENVRKTTLVGQSQRHSKGIRRSRVFCSLCNVHLCLDSVSNCWNMWHS